MRLAGFKSGGDGLTLGDEVGRPFEKVFQDVADPRGVDVKQRATAVEPVFVVLTQGRRAGGVAQVEALREHAQEHRHRKEGAGGFDQREPFGVVAGGSHGEKCRVISDQWKSGWWSEPFEPMMSRFRW